MKIKTIISQHRRDFTAIYVCEHCGATRRGSGYDDAFFHSTVIPDMVCPAASCGKKSGAEYRPLTTQYPEGHQI